MLFSTFGFKDVWVVEMWEQIGRIDVELGAPYQDGFMSGNYMRWRFNSKNFNQIHCSGIEE